MKTTEEETEQLRIVVREAHEAIKDMTGLLRQMEQAKQDLEVVSRRVFEDQMAEQVSAGLQEYKTSLDKHIELATQKVYERFDRLADILLGEDRKSKKTGKTIEELVRRRAGRR